MWRVLAATVFITSSLLTMAGILLTIVGVVMGFTEGAWTTAAVLAVSTVCVWLLAWASYRCTGPRFRREIRGPGDVLELLEVVALPFRILGVVARLFD